MCVWLCVRYRRVIQNSALWSRPLDQIATTEQNKMWCRWTFWCRRICSERHKAKFVFCCWSFCWSEREAAHTVPNQMSRASLNRSICIFTRAADYSYNLEGYKFPLRMSKWRMKSLVCCFFFLAFFLDNSNQQIAAAARTGTPPPPLHPPIQPPSRLRWTFHFLSSSSLWLEHLFINGEVKFFTPNKRRERRRRKKKTGSTRRISACCRPARSFPQLVWSYTLKFDASFLSSHRSCNEKRGKKHLKKKWSSSQLQATFFDDASSKTAALTCDRWKRGILKSWRMNCFTAQEQPAFGGS